MPVETTEILFSPISGMCNELAVLTFEFNIIKMFADFFYPVGITNRNNRVCQVLPAQVEMINCTPAIDDQFRFGDSASCVLQQGMAI